MIVPEFVAKTLSEPISLYTLVLAILTGVLAWTSIAQGRQIRREFVATFRPKLRIRGIRYAAGDKEISFSVINNGGSPATITNVVATTFYHERSQRVMAIATYTPSFLMQTPNIELKPGEQADLTHSPVVQRPTNVLGMLRPTLHFVGKVSYLDDNKILRTTGFLRRYDNDTGRFDAVEEPDYEYAD